MYKKDLALSNLKWLKCRRTKLKQIKFNIYVSRGFAIK